MSLKNLFVYDSIKLFEILNEIKDNFNFEINHIEKNDYEKTEFKKYDEYLIITSDPNVKIENCLIFTNFPEKLNKLIEKINLNFLKNKFNNQSETKIGKYVIDLNSRKIKHDNTILNLTEKECDLILFINENKKVNLKEIQKKVWHYSSDLETHTVETHIYRLRKKMLKSFNDNNFIKYDKKGYFLV